MYCCAFTRSSGSPRSTPPFEQDGQAQSTVSEPRRTNHFWFAGGAGSGLWRASQLLQQINLRQINLQQITPIGPSSGPQRCGVLLLVLHKSMTPHGTCLRQRQQRHCSTKQGRHADEDAAPQRPRTRSAAPNRTYPRRAEAGRHSTLHVSVSDRFEKVATRDAGNSDVIGMHRTLLLVLFLLLVLIMLCLCVHLHVHVQNGIGTLRRWPSGTSCRPGRRATGSRPCPRARRPSARCRRRLRLATTFPRGKLGKKCPDSLVVPKM